MVPNIDVVLHHCKMPPLKGASILIGHALSINRSLLAELGRTC